MAPQVPAGRTPSRQADNQHPWAPRPCNAAGLDWKPREYIRWYIDNVLVYEVRSPGRQRQRCSIAHPAPPTPGLPAYLRLRLHLRLAA